MKASDVYLHAAEMVATGMNHFSCCAVAGVSDSELPGGPLVRKYTALFGSHNRHFWGNEWDGGDPYDGCESVPATDEGMNCRILALCFMAAITEDEERAATARPK